MFRQSWISNSAVAVSEPYLLTDAQQRLTAKDGARIGKDLAFSTKVLVDTTLALDDNSAFPNGLSGNGSVDTETFVDTKTYKPC